jgi:hypothetical protein
VEVEENMFGRHLTQDKGDGTRTNKISFPTD